MAGDVTTLVRHQVSAVEQNNRQFWRDTHTVIGTYWKYVRKTGEEDLLYVTRYVEKEDSVEYLWWDHFSSSSTSHTARLSRLHFDSSWEYVEETDAFSWILRTILQ